MFVKEWWSALVVVHCVKLETAHKDLQSGLVQVRTDRLFLEVCLFKAII